MKNGVARRRSPRERAGEHTRERVRRGSSDSWEMDCDCPFRFDFYAAASLASFMRVAMGPHVVDIDITNRFCFCGCIGT